MNKISNVIYIIVAICIFSGCNVISGSNNQTEPNVDITEPLIIDMLDNTTELKTEPTTEDITDELTEPDIINTTEPTTMDYGIKNEVVVEGMAKDILSNMTLEEKIGQMFIVNFELLDGQMGNYYEHREITDQMINSLSKYNVGGVIFFGRNIETIEQTKIFISDLQANSKVPLFISVDEEGGNVSRIGSNNNMKMTRFPNLREIGNTNDLELARNVGEIIGSEIKELGFNLNFAPVVDVSSDESSKEMTERTLGDDAKLVAEMSAEIVLGLQEYGVSATLKHFVGQAATSEDSHEGAINVVRNIDELRKVEFIPFKTGIKIGVDFIMASHVSLSEITEGIEPVSLSKLMLTNVLRKELRFKGIIITDAMNMNAITDSYTSKVATVQSIQAGADIILMPERFEEAYNALLNAVKTGKIEEKRIDESVIRILETKLRRGVIKENTNLIATID